MNGHRPARFFLVPILIVLPLFTFGLGRLDGSLAQEPVQFGGYARLFGIPLYTYHFGGTLCVARDDKNEWWSTGDIEAFKADVQERKTPSRKVGEDAVRSIKRPPTSPSATGTRTNEPAQVSGQPAQQVAAGTVGLVENSHTLEAYLQATVLQIRAVGKVGDYDFFFGPNRKKLFVRHRDALRSYALQECSPGIGRVPAETGFAVYSFGSWFSESTVHIP